MSTNHYLSLVVGATVKEIVIEHKEEVTVTKYNQDTGVPYSSTTSHSKNFFGNIEIDDDLEDILEEHDLGSYSSYGGNDDEEVIGVEIYDLSEPAVVEVDIDLLQREINNLATKFNELGVFVKPKLFLIQSVG
jgi:hypothetical protein